jgi:hypothetical protein
MCCIGKWNCSQESLTSPEALDALLELRTTNPTLHAALNQGHDTTPPADIEEEAYQDLTVYDDCDIPLDVVSGLLHSRGSAVAANFVIGENGGIARSGSAEDLDAEEEDLNVEEEDLDVEVEPVVLGRGQRKKIGPKRYDGAIWEQH